MTIIGVFSLKGQYQRMLQQIATLKTLSATTLTKPVDMDNLWPKYKDDVA